MSPWGTRVGKIRGKACVNCMRVTFLWIGQWIIFSLQPLVCGGWSQSILFCLSSNHFVEKPLETDELWLSPFQFMFNVMRSINYPIMFRAQFTRTWVRSWPAPRWWCWRWRSVGSCGRSAWCRRGGGRWRKTGCWSSTPAAAASRSQRNWRRENYSN